MPLNVPALTFAHQRRTGVAAEVLTNFTTATSTVWDNRAFTETTIYVVNDTNRDVQVFIQGAPSPAPVLGKWFTVAAAVVKPLSEGDLQVFHFRRISTDGEWHPHLRLFVSDFAQVPAPLTGSVYLDLAGRA